MQAKPAERLARDLNHMCQIKRQILYVLYIHAYILKKKKKTLYLVNTESSPLTGIYARSWRHHLVFFSSNTRIHTHTHTHTYTCTHIPFSVRIKVPGEVQRVRGKRPRILNRDAFSYERQFFRNWTLENSIIRNPSFLVSSFLLCTMFFDVLGILKDRFTIALYLGENCAKWENIN